MGWYEGDQENRIREKMSRAFENLEARGFFAKMDWKCCQSCGCAAIPDDTKKYVFFHEQDAEGLSGGDPGCHLAFGTDGGEGATEAGYEIVEELEKAGLYVDWDGNSGIRIFVSLEKNESNA